MARRPYPSGPAFTCAALVLIAPACKPDCPDGVTDRHGYQCTPVPTTDGSSESGTTASDETFDSSSSDTSSTSDTSTTDNTSSTTEPDSVCGDDVCAPDETADNCYEDCGACGNAVVEGPEVCDNGINQDEYSPTPPAPDACAPGCTAVEFCGDAIQNGPEPCDDGEQTAECEADCSTPTCGDGVHNPLAGEACDDANTMDGDGCTADCTATERLVFVSSAEYEGDLNKSIDNPEALAGIPLADARCNALALAAGLSGTYKAWLSDSTTSPSSRFDTTFTGLYRLPSIGFPVVATGWQGLITVPLSHPIDANETGLLTNKNVWSGTKPDGTADPMNLYCNNWSENKNTYMSSYGQSSATDAAWTSSGGVDCSFSVRIYCFEDP